MQSKESNALGQKDGAGKLPSSSEPNEDVKLLGINLSNKPQWAQLLICSGGFFAGYLVNGLCEEYVYNHIRFSYGWYFSFIHSLYFLAFILLSGFRYEHIQNPWQTYGRLSAVLAGSHGLTKGSLAYLNYPAQLIFKSTKVLPVMLLGAFVPGLRRTYSVRDYVAAILLVAGLVLFTLADAATSPYFSVLGVVMVSTALLMDALVGNLQEAIFTINPATTQMEMLFCTTLGGLPFLVVPMLLTGEVFVAFSRCWERPYVYGVLLFEACWTFIGQMSVLSLVVFFGAASTAMVTTARKAVTLLLSYVIFTKPLMQQHALGLLLVAGGIGLKLFPERKVKKAAAAAGGNEFVYEPMPAEEQEHLLQPASTGYASKKPENTPIQQLEITPKD